jgi:hypothetical protein
MFRKDKAGGHKGRQADRKAYPDSTGLCGIQEGKNGTIKETMKKFHGLTN